MQYRTIRREAEVLFTQSRSRFIGAVRPVKTEEQALDFLAEIRRRHWGAKHNVYAYILSDNGIARFSDDGEPPATAGQPVMDVLKRAGLSNLCLVVTRYFGGILLGTGGLVRAYSATARMAVEAAEPVVMRLCAVGELRCAYPIYGRLAAAAAECGVRVMDSTFTDEVRLLLAVDIDQKKGFEARVADISCGDAELCYKHTRYIEEVCE